MYCDAGIGPAAARMEALRRCSRAPAGGGGTSQAVCGAVEKAADRGSDRIRQSRSRRARSTARSSRIRSPSYPNARSKTRQGQSAFDLNINITSAIFYQNARRLSSRLDAARSKRVKTSVDAAVFGGG